MRLAVFRNLHVAIVHQNFNDNLVGIGCEINLIDDSNLETIQLNGCRREQLVHIIEHGIIRSGAREYVFPFQVIEPEIENE